MDLGEMQTHCPNTNLCEQRQSLVSAHTTRLGLRKEKERHMESSEINRFLVTLS